MTKTRLALFSILFGSLLLACDDGLQLEENIPVGNSELSIIRIEPERGLIGDTLTIFGSGFNILTYQNRVIFTAKNEETFFVKRNGLITDSLISRPVPANRTIGLVVDAQPDQLRVVVPSTNIVSGPVFVTFGVDTVISEQPYTLIYGRPRPAIQDVSPAIGAPGAPLVIDVDNTAQNKDSIIVRFGNELIRVDSARSSNIFVDVPNLFAGPVDLSVAALTFTEDTLWAALPFTFTVLPADLAPLTVATGRSASNTRIISYGNTENTSEGVLLTLEDFEVDREQLEIFIPRGIVLDTLENQFYWINNSFGDSFTQIVTGDLLSNRAVMNVVTTDLELDYRDIDLDNGSIYVAGSDIRKFDFLPNGDVSSESSLIWSSTDTVSILNLKVLNQNFYWCDNLNNIIYSGEFINGTMENVQELFNASTGLENPGAIALDERKGLIFISDKTADNSTKIFRGSLNGNGTLTEIYENEELADFESITDMEVDSDEDLLYFTLPNGLYKISSSGGGNRASLVYSFSKPTYFDF